MGEQVAARSTKEKPEGLTREETERFSDGGLAQLGEHLPCKQGVESSNLLVSTIAMSKCADAG